MKFLNFENVLCLSPHPDDVEYGMLGSVLKHQNTNFTIITLSIGGKFDKSSGDIRHKECEKVWKDVNNVEIKFSNIKHIEEISENEIIFNIEKKYNLSKYESIFVPPLIDSHQDHRKLNSVATSLVRQNKCGIVEYATPSTLTEWIPNYFVDLNHNIWNTKLDKLKLFESQKGKSYFDERSLNIFHSNYECSKRGMNIVENFRIKKVYS